MATSALGGLVKITVVCSSLAGGVCSTAVEGRPYRDNNKEGRITLLSVVGKMFCKVLNNRLVQHFDKGGVLHEGQAGFRSCVDNIYTRAG